MPRTARRSAKDRGKAVALVREHYPAVAADLLNPLVELLRLTRLCAGDIETFLILLAIGMRTAEHERFRTIPSELVTGGALNSLPSRGTNVRSVADSLQMPRETVRRKIAELIEAGWVERRNGSLAVTPQAFPKFEPVTQAIVELAASQYEVVAALLASQAGGEGGATG